MSNTIDQLTNAGKRTRTHDAQMVIKLPAHAKELVNKAAEAQGFSSATIVRFAIAEYLDRRGYNRG